MEYEHRSTEPFDSHNVFGTSPRSEWLYVIDSIVGDEAMASGRQADVTPGRLGWRLANFVAHPRCREAGLLESEVIGVRLYTGPMYVHYNGRVLRRGLKGEFVTTIHVINSAIVKLARQQPACEVYRGVKGGFFPEAFWTANKHGVMGGVELGMMSTTTDRAVAMSFAKTSDASGKCSMVFQIRMGMVDCGADVSFLSQFPGESEILFGPLTGLEVVSSPTVVDGTIVVPLRLSTNQRALTIEQVVAKLKTSHLQLVELIIDNFTANGDVLLRRHASWPKGTAQRTHWPLINQSRDTPRARAATTELLCAFPSATGVPVSALEPLKSLRAESEAREGSYFNVADNFQSATGRIFEARAAAFAALRQEQTWADATRAALLCAREGEHRAAIDLLQKARLEVDGGERWPLRVAQWMINQGLPHPWPATFVVLCDLAANRGDASSTEGAQVEGGIHEATFARLVAASGLPERDRLQVGRQVMVLEKKALWQRAFVKRLGPTESKQLVDVKVGGWRGVAGLPLTRAVVVDLAGAGALLRAAAELVEALLQHRLLRSGLVPDW
eukprot:1991994-Prymnesium_polylepis.1